MSKFTKEMVDNYAKKLLIDLTEEENKMVLDEFEIIDKNCDIVNTISNISSVNPMTHTLDDFIVELREDECEESVEVSELLKNSDESDGREIEIIKVVG